MTSISRTNLNQLYAPTPSRNGGWNTVSLYQLGVEEGRSLFCLIDEIQGLMLDTRESISVCQSAQTTAVEETSTSAPLGQQLYADWQAIRHHPYSPEKGLEQVFFSSGWHALILHRIAHQFRGWKIPILPRLISQFNRLFTGVEIHPGAKIGSGVLIVHGLGVVIGETAVVGEGSIIYQDVTLGGTGKETAKRHPTLGKNVVVEPGAKVLGNICIGNDVRIGAGAIVLRNAPERSIVVGIPGRIIYRKLEGEDAFEEQSQPDLEAQVIQVLFERIKSLETQVEQIKNTTHLVDSRLELISCIPRDSSNSLVTDFLDGAGI